MFTFYFFKDLFLIESSEKWTSLLSKMRTALFSFDVFKTKCMLGGGNIYTRTQNTHICFSVLVSHYSLWGIWFLKPKT